MNFKVLGIALGTVGVLALIVIMGAVSQKNESSAASTGSNNEYGTSPNGIVFTEAYSLGCPACKDHHDAYLHHAREKYKDQIVFRLKHFPLKVNFRNAFAAHRAVEAAAMQNKFWEMHDKIYETQPEWKYPPVNRQPTKTQTNPVPFFEGLAEELGLDVEQFKADFKSQEVSNIINADQEEVQAKGATDTPTIFIKKGNDREDEKVNSSTVYTQRDQWFDEILEEFEDNQDSTTDEEPDETTGKEETDGSTDESEKEETTE